MARETEETIELEETPTVYVRTVAAADVLSEMSRSEIDVSALELDEESTLYAIHTEDGQRMAVFTDRDAAFAAARYHGAEPVSVH
ncbi:DUF1150 domain-containing protein [Marinicauda salina]|uniref:DUF1150 domain-containing protein n=1 Tax=Marinicauda salina TaxID=2135793 RepID=A0A2U2BW17_9PROT|nr:DUF1150 family protein [Marinicauda salina]PWE18192.1 DUF1150 domain-containing protein [Marinicauda salina]